MGIASRDSGSFLLRAGTGGAKGAGTAGAAKSAKSTRSALAGAGAGASIGGLAFFSGWNFPSIHEALFASGSSLRITIP